MYDYWTYRSYLISFAAAWLQWHTSNMNVIRNTYRHFYLTHWGRVTHICVFKLTIIGSDNGLLPGRLVAWTNAGILLIGPLGTNLSEILIEILTFSFKKMRLKVSSAKWRPLCLGLNVLIRNIANGEINERRFSNLQSRSTALHNSYAG